MHLLALTVGRRRYKYAQTIVAIRAASEYSHVYCAVCPHPSRVSLHWYTVKRQIPNIPDFAVRSKREGEKGGGGVVDKHSCDWART